MLQIFSFLRALTGRFIAYRIIISENPEDYLINSLKTGNLFMARWIKENFNLDLYYDHFQYTHNSAILDFIEKHVPLTEVVKQDEYSLLGCCANDKLPFLKWIYGKMINNNLRGEILGSKFYIYYYITSHGNLSILKWLYAREPEIILIKGFYIFIHGGANGFLGMVKWIYSRLKNHMSAEELDKLCHKALKRSIWYTQSIKVSKWLHGKIKTNIKPHKWILCAARRNNLKGVKWLYGTYKHKHENLLTHRKCRIFIAAGYNIAWNRDETFKWLYGKLKKLNLHGAIFAKDFIIFHSLWRDENNKTLEWLFSRWKDFDDPNIKKKI